MKTFYGNYLGVVITGGEKDPEGRGRTQVFIPNIMPALYELWNKEGEDISFDVIGQGLEGEINPEVYKRLQQILPWAECAAPIIGASPSYKPNILGQASEALRNVGRAVVDTAKEALNTLTGGDVTAATPSGDQAGNLAISNEIAKGRYASGKCGTAVGNEVMVKMYGYSDKEVRAASPDGRRDGKNYNEICKNLGWTAVPISRPEDAPVGSIISYGATSENTYGHVEAVGQNAKGQKTYLFGLGEISSPGGGTRVSARNKKGFQGVAWVPPPDRQALALKKVGLPDKTASAYPNPSPTTGMTPDPGTSGKNEQQLAASLNQEIAGAQQLSLQSAEATAQQSFGSLDGVSSSARSSFSGGGGSTSTTSFKGNQSATPSPTPITTYSVGKSVGGTDETQDKWTNKGYTSTGKNLTPGCVAVDTKVYPLGTVFKDTNTGKVYIATDKHGNKNPNVVDVYVPPSQYKGQSGSMNLAVVDTIPKSQIPKTPEGVQSFLSQYGEVPPGESASNFLAGKNEGVTENLAVEATQPSVKNPTSFQGTAGPNTNNQALGMFGYASEGQAVWVFFREGNPLFPVYFAASYGQKEWQNMYGHASPGVGAGITKTNPQADGKFPTSPEAAQTGALPGTEAMYMNTYGGGIRSANTTEDSQVGPGFLFQLYDKNGSHLSFLKDHTEFYSAYDHVSRVMADHQDITEANKEVRVRGDYNTFTEQDLIVTVGNWSEEAIKAADEIQGYINEAMNIKAEAGGGGGGGTSSTNVTDKAQANADKAKETATKSNIQNNQLTDEQQKPYKDSLAKKAKGLQDASEFKNSSDPVMRGVYESAKRGYDRQLAINKAKGIT